MTPNPTTTPRVLLVDDDEIIYQALVHEAAAMSANVVFDYADDVESAVEKLNGNCFDAALIDVRLPGVSGVSLGALVREYDVNIPLAYLTNLDTEVVRREAMAQGAYFLFKMRFFGSAEGMHTLITIIVQMVTLNPCLPSSTRQDNHGFARQLPRTPIELPAVLSTLLDYKRQLAAAA